MIHIAFITGICGQDGSYLAELLLEKGYIIYGLKRRHSMFSTDRIEHIRNKIKLYYGDMTDQTSIINVLSDIKNKYLYNNNAVLEIYNLAAQSHVQISFQTPEYTAECDGIGVLKLLESIKALDIIKYTKFYQASTSELYGLVKETPQNENTPFYPRSPYACSKLYAHSIVVNYREAYNMYACCGILFNHESPRRGENFVTRKITQGIRSILKDTTNTYILKLGNLDSLRDWGHAKDYVRAMWLMLQQDTPEDYVISTGIQYSVRDFVEKAFKVVNIDIIWKNSGIEEIGIDKNTNRVLISIDPIYYRPSEVSTLLGDSTKARNKLGWSSSITFDELVKEMVLADINI